MIHPKKKGPIMPSRHAPVLTPSRQFCCCFTNLALKKGPITPSRHASLSRYYANNFAVSRITSWKNGQSRHHTNRWGLPAILAPWHMRSIRIHSLGWLKKNHVKMIVVHSAAIKTWENYSIMRLNMAFLQRYKYFAIFTGHFMQQIFMRHFQEQLLSQNTSSGCSLVSKNMIIKYVGIKTI